ncbi:hypothetical protein MHU86_6838 [Fragilaria crotonensis]|nr:hypothetical protein MHU86_6838 [Fragilaria crotonensis]
MSSETSQQEGAPPRNRKSRKSLSSQKTRQQRWSNFTKMKASSLMQVRQSQQDVSTINEENDGDTFDEEYNFSAGYGPNASFSLGNDEDGTSATSAPTSSNGFNVNVNVEDDDDEDDNTAIGDGMDDSAYEAAPPSLSTPPVHRSVDVLPAMFSLHQPSNVLTDEASVYSEVTEHSMATQQINNRHANHSDDVTVMTTSTMVTRQVGNTVAQRESNHAQLLLSTPPSSFVNSPNGGAGGPSADSDSNRHHHHYPPSSSLSSPSNINTTTPRRISSGSRRPSTMGQTLMNNQGHTMSEEEMRLVWEAAGKCIECGVVTTHKKEKYGPFGTFRRMAPQTVEGFSYKGYCLRCHDVPQLRRLLNEPDIPLDLMRDDPRSASIRSLQTDNPHNPHHHDAIVAEFLNRKSPIGVLCTSIKFQLFCGMVLLSIAGAIVAIAISMAKGPEPWVSPAPTVAPTLAPTTTYPTTSPTSWEWTLSSEIRTEIESFGYRIDLSSSGDVLAVSSPNYDGGKGRFDIYLLEEVGDEQKWVTPNFETGTPQTGTNATQYMSQGISLSGGGSTVAVGSPGNGTLYGLVQVYHIDLESLRISTKGQVLVGPSIRSEFGYSVSLNFDGSRLFVGAPNYGVSSTQVNGLVRCYVYNANTDLWEQVGDDMSGLTSGSRFGHSISSDDSGYRVVIGSPLDSTKWENAGQVLIFQLEADMTWQPFPENQVVGADVGSNMGSTVAANEDGLIFTTNDNDKNVEKFSNAGIASVYGAIEDTGQITLIGFPIAGTHYNAGFGHDLDISDSGEIVIASGNNIGKKAGSIQVHLFNMGQFEMYGKELTKLEVGTCDWFGAGPSVTIAARQLRMAVGYECIMSNGISRSTVRLFDFFAVEA